MPALIRRVRANLSFMLWSARVTKTGNRMTARWSCLQSLNDTAPPH